VAGLIEAVPNFSEGVRRDVIDTLAGVAESIPGAFLLDRTSDRDHNRTVLTIAGTPSAVEETAIRLVGEAAARIDLREHRGVHPRMGACDVLPFVPLDGSTIEECVAVAHRVGGEIWKRYGVPVYFYEAAALQPARRKLEDVRRGGFENPQLFPDVGRELHPSAGATIIGARKFLVAYNINLKTSDTAVAKKIAGKVRASSGGLPCVKALGLELKSRGQAQVSLNLTDFEVTPVDAAYRAVEREALALGVEIAGSELIGLIPRRALPMIDVKWENVDASKVLENRLAAEVTRIVH
jgi:glutamate formiminotransferase